MKAGLVIIGIWSAILLFLSLAIVGACGSLYAGSYYPFTLPFIFSAGLCVLLVILGLICKRFRVAVFWVATPLHALLFLPFHYAITR